jgi:allantoin racemase
MKQLLVINPNTGLATTERLRQFINPSLTADTQLTCVSARFGAPYIACEASYAVAGHAVLDAWAQAQPATHILIGCFGDPGLHALREAAQCPVTGLAEAAFIEAAARGPFAIVTGGARWRAILQRLALSLGYADSLQHIETVEATGAELLADPAKAIQILTAACQQAAKQPVNSIILGGAGLAGYAEQVQPFVELPIIDSVLAGVRVVMGGDLPAPLHGASDFALRALL